MKGVPVEVVDVLFGDDDQTPAARRIASMLVASMHARVRAAKAPRNPRAVADHMQWGLFAMLEVMTDPRHMADDVRDRNAAVAAWLERNGCRRPPTKQELARWACLIERG